MTSTNLDVWIQNKVNFMLFLDYLVVCWTATTMDLEQIPAGLRWISPLKNSPLSFLLPYFCPPLLPLKSLLVFTQSSVNEGIFCNSRRLFPNDLSCLHAQWFLQRISNVWETHFLLQNLSWLCCKKVIRLLAIRGIQKLQIQWQLKAMANEKLVVKLNFVLYCHKAVALRNTKYWDVDWVDSRDSQFISDAFLKCFGLWFSWKHASNAHFIWMPSPEFQHKDIF